MQNAISVTFGVSPAYFVSNHGEAFGPEEIARDLPGLAAIGFSSYQTEVFDRSALALWDTKGSAELIARAADVGLCSNVFVAHFLGHEFSRPDAIEDAAGGKDDLKRVVELAGPMSTRTTIVVPILPLSRTDKSFFELWAALVEKVSAYQEAVRDAGMRFAVETVPGSLVSSSAWFDRLRSDVGSGDLWCLLDTGNVWAAGEVVTHSADRMGAYTAAVHLCDARDNTTRSVTPGTGGVDWPAVLAALRRAGYDRSLDIEIACPAEETSAAYKTAKEYLARIAGQRENGGTQHA